VHSWGNSKLVKELVYISYASAFVLIITGLFSNLYDIATETSDKTIIFADDMRNAIDCATRGISIYECSPNLGQEQFQEELEDTRELMNKTIEEIKELA